MKFNSGILYLFLGGILYSFYFFGLLSTEIKGLSFLFLLVFLVLVFVKSSEFSINPKNLLFPTYLNLAVILAFFYSTFSSYSIYKLIFFLLKFNTLFFIPFFINEYHIKYFFKGILWILFTVLLVFLFYVLLNFSTFDANNRLEIGVLNPIWISRIALELILIVIFIFKPKFKKLVGLIFLVFLILYASGSKGPIISFLIVLMIYNFRNYKFANKILGFGLIFLLLVLFFTFFSNYIQNDFIRDRFLTIIPEGDEQKLLEDNRAVFIPFLLNNFFNSDIFTILFGSGLGNSGFFMFGLNYDFRYYPHNLIVELMLELGVVNTIIIVFFIVRTIIFQKNIFVYLLIYFTINSMFSGDLILNEFIFFYLGLTLANESKKLA